MKKFGSNMEMDVNHGQIVQNTKENGKMTRFKGKESFGTLIKILTRVNSLMEKQMESVNT